MASFPQNHLQKFLHHPPSQSQQSKPYRDLYSNNMEGQISQQVSYFNTPNLLDNHPPYIPPFLVAGLAPGPAREEDGPESQWKRPTEQIFLENNINHNNSNTNSQMSSVEFFQPRTVSTGLGLSLDNPRLTSSSSGESALIGLVGDALDQELRRQDAEIGRYIKLQGDRLRQTIVEKFQMTQLQTISYVEDKVLQILREKESQIEDINRKNADLETRMEQFALEANAWQQRAMHSENTINTLKLSLQQAYAEGRDSKEGCGDSEIDDTASCCGGSKPSSSEAAVMKCKVCRVGEVCMLLLPCKHLCLCRDCEGRTGVCPSCGLSKYIGMEVYL